MKTPRETYNEYVKSRFVEPKPSIADRIAELEREIARWHYLIGRFNNSTMAEREDLRVMTAELSRLRNEQPSMIDNVRTARDARHGTELVAALRDHNAAVVNLRDSAADEIERLLPSPATSPGPQDVREGAWVEPDENEDGEYILCIQTSAQVCIFDVGPKHFADALAKAINEHVKLAALAQSDAQPILDDIGEALESRGYVHMINGKGIGALLDELETLRAQSDAGPHVWAFARAVLHGDDEHKTWLLEAADAYIDGKPLPAPHGKEITALAQSDAQPIGWQVEADAKEAHAIISRIWKALGISKYADAQGKAIDEIVANLVESHKQQLTERREEELREDAFFSKGAREALEKALKIYDDAVGHYEYIVAANVLAKVARDILATPTPSSAGLIETAEIQRLRTALGYFLNAEAHYGTFPDSDDDAKQLRKSGTWNMLTGRNLLTDADVAKCGEAMKAHTVAADRSAK